MADKVPGINFSEPVVPLTYDSPGPSHLAQFGKGGWREVLSIEERDSITDERSELGMAVYVTSESKLYILSGLDTSTTPYTKTWTEFQSGTSDNVIRNTDTFDGFVPLVNGEIVQYVGETDVNYTKGYFYKAVAQGTNPETYNWEQINVQPEQDLSWGDIGGTLSDQTDLQEELTGLQDQIDNLSARGRYLTTWDMTTGLPGELPTSDNPYYYENGDYYIVSKAQTAEPETLQALQVFGTEYRYISLDILTYKEKRFGEDTPVDEDDVFNYSKTITTASAENHGTEQLAVIDQNKIDLAYIQRVSEAEAYYDTKLIGVSDQIKTRWYEYGGVLYLNLTVNVQYWSDDPTPKQLEADFCYRQQTYTVDSAWTLKKKKKLVKDWINTLGLEVVGDLYYGIGPWEEEVHSIQREDNEPLSFWTLNGTKLPLGETPDDYGIILSGKAPEYGDSIKVFYRTQKVNYKPDGSYYTEGVASTAVETQEVYVNDTYIYNGAVWLLLSNTTKEVSFSALAGSPYDNEELADALNSKVTTTDTASQVYGTDSSGNQTTYSLDDFGKVDDVQINGTTIVENKVANILVDSEATEDSENLITSGGVFDALKDVSVTYTAEEGATVDVGGFSVGDKPENMSFQDFADTLLHKYLTPTISSNISPSTTPLQLGSVVDITMVASVTRRAPSKYPLTTLTFYDNGVQKEQITDGMNVKTGSWSHKFTNVGTTVNTKYYKETLKATVKDSQNSTASAEKTISFVAPTFYGKVAVPAATEAAGNTQQYIQSNIETIISSCTKKITADSSVDYPCNLNVEHYIFITPFTVTQITDTVTQFKYIDSTSNFNYTRTENGVTTAYKVYYLTRQATGNGYNFRFSISGINEG